MKRRLTFVNQRGTLRSMTSVRQIRGTRIRQLREELGMSGRALARESGLTQAHLNRVELGVVGISDENLAAVAAVLGVPVSALYEEST